MMISYAQNFEDVMLWRALKHVDKGFYIDVGANHPQHDSVTKHFYDNGWTGINIEPIQDWYQQLKAEREKDTNLQIAVADSDTEITIYDFPGTGLSTLDQATAERHEQELGIQMQQIQVQQRTLNAVCAEYCHGEIHFLKVDVEGAEKLVLSGLDLQQFRPWILVIESTLPNSQHDEHEKWESLITSKDYEFVYFDGLNRFYIAKEHVDSLKQAFELPPNVLDGYSTNAEQQVELLNRQINESEQRLRDMAAKAEAEAVRANKAEQQTMAVQERATQAETRAENEALRANNAEQQVQQETERANQQALVAENKQEVIDELSEQVDQAQQRIEQLQQETEGLQNSITQLKASTSWKLTKPIRVLGEFVAKLKR